MGSVVDRIETEVLSEPWDVDRRLSEMRLTRAGLLAARDVAMSERANATPFHAANAAGTFAYQYGTWALRDQFVGADWVEDRTDGVEAIRCDALNIKVAFSNVDKACDTNHNPKPRSKKGAGAERVSGTGLFSHLPHYAPRPTGGAALYYLMTDEDGAAELTRPVIKDETFVGAIERIYLSDGGESAGGDLLLADDGIANEFDPQVARK